MADTPAPPLPVMTQEHVELLEALFFGLAGNVEGVGSPYGEIERVVRALAEGTHRIITAEEFRRFRAWLSIPEVKP